MVVILFFVTLGTIFAGLFAVACFREWNLPVVKPTPRTAKPCCDEFTNREKNSVSTITPTSNHSDDQCVIFVLPLTGTGKKDKWLN